MHIQLPAEPSVQRHPIYQQIILSLMSHLWVSVWWYGIAYLVSIWLCVESREMKFLFTFNSAGPNHNEANLNGHFSKQSNWWLFHILRNWVIILPRQRTNGGARERQDSFSDCDKSRRARSFYITTEEYVLFHESECEYDCVNNAVYVFHSCIVKEKSQLIWETSKSRFQGLSTILVLARFSVAGGIYSMFIAYTLLCLCCSMWP